MIKCMLTELNLSEICNNDAYIKWLRNTRNEHSIAISGMHDVQNEYHACIRLTSSIEESLHLLVYESIERIILAI